MVFTRQKRQGKIPFTILTGFRYVLLLESHFIPTRSRTCLLVPLSVMLPTYLSIHGSRGLETCRSWYFAGRPEVLHKRP